jgi:hypothetical protein
MHIKIFKKSKINKSKVMSIKKNNKKRIILLLLKLKRKMLISGTKIMKII